MNKEEMENKLNGICQDCMWLEKIEPIFNRLQQENKQLKDNWNKLKEELSKCIYDNSSGEIDEEMWLSSDVLNKMQEIEKGK